MLQDITNDNLIDYSKGWFKSSVDVVNFEYIPSTKYLGKRKHKTDSLSADRKEVLERAALSWHLTLREKESLKMTIYEDNNQASIAKLKTLLSGEVIPASRSISQNKISR